VPFGGHKLEIIIYCTRLQCESKQNRKQKEKEKESDRKTEEQKERVGANACEK